MGSDRGLSGFDAVIAKLPVDKLEETYLKYEDLKRQWIREMVLKRNRIDIFMREVLGYEVQPYHLAIMRHQFRYPKSLVLAFRGAGKSTTATIAKALHSIVKNPDVRILIASKSASNAEVFLKEIKAHLERNTRLNEIFGQQYDPHRCRKWDNREIEVLPRKSNAKEATITTIGVEGTAVGRHYDMILPDDLVDEENSRTSAMRTKTATWFYKTLEPTLEPPDAKVPERGQMHMSGTRYHPEDLYATMLGEAIDGQGGEMKETTLLVPALDEEGRSPWPEKYPPAWFEEKRKRAGLIIFNGQYMLDTEAMKGTIFRYDDCQWIEPDEVPAKLPAYQGTDLAVGEEGAGDDPDHFSLVTIKYDRKNDYYYVMDWFDDVVRFSKQRDTIISKYDAFDPVRNLVEAQAYQQVQVSEVKRKRPTLRVFGVKQRDDKITRAQKASAKFDEGKVFFVKGGKMHLLVDQLVRFTGEDDASVHDDGVDALELAMRAPHVRPKKKRRKKTGLIGGAKR